MAITTPTITGDGTYPIEVDRNIWALNSPGNVLVGGSLNVELKAAPTRDNSALYLTHVTMSTAKNTNRVLDVRLTLVDGAGVNVLGPIQLQENGQSHYSKDFKHPLKLTDKKALDLTGAGAAAGYQAACFVYVEGFTADKPLG